MKTSEKSDPQGIRHAINQHPGFAIAAIGVVIVGVLAFVFWPASKPVASVFYSEDDGANYFKDSGKIPPFIHNGKEAVQAMVFSCDGKKPYVGYLIRYTQKTRAMLEATQGTSTGPVFGMEVKKPGDKDWVGQFDPTNPPPGGPREREKQQAAYQSIVNVMCPDGKPSTPVMP